MAGTNRSMSSYEARRATFFAGSEESGKSRKKSVPLWPHPINLTEDALEDDNNGSSSSSTSMIMREKRSKRFPTPSELAHLGLYFDPSASDESDACVLFPENVVLSGWKLGDDVAKRIRKLVPNASLLTIQESRDAAQQDDGKKDAWLWKNEDLLPTSKSMISMRQKTFTPSWPYDSKKGWKPTSKKLASAGFHYFPNEEEDDCARCQYCELVLGGWEKTDDPMHEHQRRRPSCPFFNCSLKEVPYVEIVMSPVAEVNKKTRSASTSTKRARAVSKRKAKDEDEDEDEIEAQEGQPVNNNVRKDQEQEHLDHAQTERSQPATSKVLQAQKEQVIGPKHESKEETEAPKKIATSRKASRKVQREETADAAPESIPPQTKVKANEQAGSAVEQTRTESKAIPASEEIAMPKEAMKETATKPSLPTNTVTKKQRLSEQENLSSPKDVNSDHLAKTSSPKRFSELDPFMIEPLKKIPKLTSAEEEMTVEAWLKTQVFNACQEMEREGKERIERLREQIEKGRTEIETVLRGRSMNTMVTEST